MASISLPEIDLSERFVPYNRVVDAATNTACDAGAGPAA
jgi:hypothetical protein